MNPTQSFKKLFDRIANSIRFRLKRRRLCLGKRASSAGAEPFSVRIATKDVVLQFPESERGVFEHEFGEIFLRDCYGIDLLPGDIRTVLDVGANLGLFTMAVIHRFPAVAIDSYEPNGEIEKYLRANLANNRKQPKMCAVGAASGKVSIETSGNSLFSKTTLSPDGTTPQVAFDDAIQALGGAVDVVKLDCEGAEWEIFKCTDAWKHVRFLVMEYHLWANPNSTYSDVVQVLRELGFEVTHHSPSEESTPDGFGGTFGLLHARKRPHEQLKELNPANGL